MKCPHCTLGIAETWQPGGTVGWDGRQPGAKATQVDVRSMACPECKGFICVLDLTPIYEGQPPQPKRTVLVYPKVTAVAPLPPEVPEPYRSDYAEAAVILTLSAQASAAISRRCLQAVLRVKAGTTKRDLDGQIDEVLASHTLPSDLAADVDAVRTVGNFATHEQKSTVTDMVLPVEAGEAEWTLGVLEGMLDFYFVRPAKSQARRDAFNAKLAEAGKPSLKVPPSTP
jgi:hypothetical protein